jgi:hypothetical protein
VDMPHARKPMNDFVSACSVGIPSNFSNFLLPASRDGYDLTDVSEAVIQDQGLKENIYAQRLQLSAYAER